MRAGNFAIIATILLLTSCGQDVSTDGRIVKNFDGEVVFNLPNDSLEVFPSRPFLTEHGLFVYDKKDGRIKLVDMENNQIIRSYGGGKGRGPGEHEGFFNLDVWGDTLAMVDTGLHRVTLFDVNTSEVIQTIPVRRDPFKLFLVKGGFVLNTIGADSLLYLYNTKSDSAISSASMLDIKVRSTYVLSVYGHYTSRNRNNEVIYIPLWDNRVFVFDLDSSNIRRSIHFSTFDTTTFTPSTVQSAAGVMFQAPNPEFSRSGGVYNDGKLYILNYSHDKKANKRRYYYIDIYDHDFNYMYSIDMINELPYPQSISLYGNKLCFMGLENLRCYEMNW
jgi:hypothetical protein